MDSAEIPWRRESQLALIQKVKELPTLWDVTNILYHKKGIKRKAYQLVCDHLKQKFPELQYLNAGTVKTKFNHLRTYYQRELKKIQKTAIGTEVKTESKWEYFRHCSFIHTTQLLDNVAENTVAPEAFADQHQHLEGEAEGNEDEFCPLITSITSGGNSIMVPTKSEALSPTRSTPPLPVPPTPTLLSAQPSSAHNPKWQERVKKRKSDAVDASSQTMDNDEAIVKTEQKRTPSTVLSHGQRIGGVIDTVWEQLPPANRRKLLADLLFVLAKHVSGDEQV
ncbi:uncharacterized protein LOC121875133 isoform X2 [Homarus americanus]|uniref:uncharacterized protein LOC121875133 isoform X2 n=1 Tax=Homarus americanus TaxID=6706 RepID=UPI001C47E5B7|nr:uncharacterized protein LOC121875133 isoform X2 [Homarus americanus]